MNLKNLANAVSQLSFQASIVSNMTVNVYTLAPLPYSYDALEPAISAQIMELHHSRHHQTYVTNLNAALQKYATATEQGDIASQIALQAAIRFNGGGHINHSLFWENLCAPTSADAAPGVDQSEGGHSNRTFETVAPQLTKHIQATWGSVDAFKQAMSNSLLAIQGSGWGWLVKEEGSTTASSSPQLKIVTTKDQDPVVGNGQVPILGIDMWEHAYYLQYLNGKAAYLNNIWSVINWRIAEKRFLGGRDDTFAVLKASM